MRVLVVNAGSSSLKLRLLDARDTIAHSADLPAGPDGVDTSGLAGNKMYKKEKKIINKKNKYKNTQL